MSKIAVIAGGGNFPYRLIEELTKDREVYLVGIKGFANTNLANNSSLKASIYVRLGSVGFVLRFLRQHDIKEIVFIGNVKRPRLSRIMLDITGIKLLFKLLKLRIRGDDNLLTTIIDFLEQQGFIITAADKLLGSLTILSGDLGKNSPSCQQMNDIRLGTEFLAVSSRFDIGQAVVVANGVIIAVEGAEGTNAMIRRAGEFAHKPILVKASKANCQKLIDIPAIGLATIEALIAAGFAGVAVQANHVICDDIVSTVSLADKHNIFLHGF